MIFSPKGYEIDPEVISPSSEVLHRGEHDINNEMIFESNPGFIFHDSRGFECGSVDETDKVKRFLETRGKARQLKEQVHAVWYCLSTDTDRHILEADKSFFSEYGTGKAPVIAIFTKFDALITKSFSTLRKEGMSRAKAKSQAPAQAEARLNEFFTKPLLAFKPPLTDFVLLKDMQKDSSTCADLIEKTADAIDDDALKLLLLSVQQNNIDLCARYALEHLRAEAMGLGQVNMAISAVAVFPHAWLIRHWFSMMSVVPDYEIAHFTDTTGLRPSQELSWLTYYLITGSCQSSFTMIDYLTFH
ncbi:hypothetical protein HWV62_32081 [Athelia sp. TMB]|nr:hypothetical protein HWV62_32081 [Athelia sp. TMB]